MSTTQIIDDALQPLVSHRDLRSALLTSWCALADEAVPLPRLHLTFAVRAIDVSVGAPLDRVLDLVLAMLAQNETEVTRWTWQARILEAWCLLNGSPDAAGEAEIRTWLDGVAAEWTEARSR